MWCILNSLTTYEISSITILLWPTLSTFECRTFTFNGVFVHCESKNFSHSWWMWTESDIQPLSYNTTHTHTHSFNGQLSMSVLVRISICPAVFLLFLGALILSTSYTNVCSAPWKQHGSNNVWSITIYTLCSLLSLYSFDLICQEKVDSFFF